MERTILLYFFGGTIGAWVIFFLIAFGSALWIWYYSLNRKLSVWGWRIGILLLALLTLPSAMFRIGVNPFPPPAPGGIEYIQACLRVFDCLPVTARPLLQYFEAIYYMGLLGALLAVVVAVAYYLNFQGRRERDVRYPSPPPAHLYRPPPPPQPQQPPPPPPPPALPPAKPKVNAWLIAQDGTNYQLCKGETTIGRFSQNDIYLTKDTTISKNHAKIVQQHNHFMLVDLYSTNGTRVNGRWVRTEVLLQPNDEIQFGDNTKVRFITSLG